LKKKDRFIGNRVNPKRIYHDTRWLDEAIERSVDWNFPDQESFEQFLDQKLAEHFNDATPKDIVQRDQAEQIPVSVASLDAKQSKLTVSFGLEKYLPDTGQIVYQEIIPIGTKLPCEKKWMITTVTDQQDSIDQWIYSSKTGSTNLDDAEAVGVIQLSNLEPMAAGSLVFETIFSVDSSGSLYVQTYEQDSQRLFAASFSLSQPHMYDHKVGRWRDREGRFTRAPQETYNQRVDSDFGAEIEKEDELSKKSEWFGKKKWGLEPKLESGINLNTSGALAVLIAAYGLAILGIAGALVYSLIRNSGSQ
jgi:hypothetical protein